MGDDLEACSCCHVCLYRFSQPHHVPLGLHCGHTFCKSCLTSLLEDARTRQEGGRPPCPVCRAPIAALSVSQLSTNYGLLAALEMLEAHAGLPAPEQRPPLPHPAPPRLAGALQQPFITDPQFFVLTHNNVGVPVTRGGASGTGGDTGLSPSALWYCGRTAHECRCGTCDGRCGPSDGCPCHSCVQLSGFKVNRRGGLAWRGAVGAANGGDTQLLPAQLWYCGARARECRCGSCDARCGPTDGCPCNACVELVEYQVNSRGQLATPGVDAVGGGGDTGLRASQLWYCGAPANECRCGTCNGKCGPQDGCPCNSCVVLVAHLRAQV